MSRQFYSNPQLSRISSNLSRALLGSASDDAAIARSRLTNAQAALAQATRIFAVLENSLVLLKL